VAVIYLSSVDGSDVDDGSTWALAKATMAAALTAAGAGGTVYVDSAHAESATGTKNLASPGTAASPCIVLSVDRTGNPEPPTTLLVGASVATTTSSPTITITGYSYYYGITFRPGNAATSGILNVTTNALGRNVFDACTFVSAGTPTWNIGATASVAAGDIDFISCTFNTTTILNIGSGRVWFLGGSWSTAFPTTGFQSASTRHSHVHVNGMDLSGLGSGKNLVNVAQGSGAFDFNNCKLGSSVSITTGTAILPGVFVTVVNCDSADTNYRYYYTDYFGTITHESTIVRTGGASDGTTPISRKLVTSANSKFYGPLVSDPIDVWLDSPGALTGTIEIVTDNVTLTDAEAWVEVEYLGTSGFPLGSFAHDRASTILTTPANQTTSTETWTTTGLATPVKQALAVSFTTAEKGWARFRVHLAKASTTMYFDPEVNGLGITSGRQWQGASYINEGAGGSGGAGPLIGGRLVR